MSDENVEIVRDGLGRFAATREFPAERVTADFVWDMSNFHGWPEQQVYAGADGARTFLREWTDAWEDWELEIDALHDAGERVVALLRQRGTSKAAGMPVEMYFAQVWTLRDGKEARMDMYSDPDEALEATGLREQPMSEENVEIVRGVYDAWQRADFDAALEPFDEDIEWVGPPDISRAGGEWDTRGHEGVRRSLGRWLGTWVEYRFELRELIDHGDEVLACGWQHGRGKGSGVEVSEEIFSVWTLQAGKIVRQRMFRDRAQALEAAGLSE